MVLVVDNCEDVLDEAADQIDALLAACPNVRILATSREALGVNGEQVSGVPSLEVESGTGRSAVCVLAAVTYSTAFAFRAGPDSGEASMTHTRMALGMLGAGLLLLVIQPSQAVGDPPDPSAYCAQEDTVAQVLCMEQETSARTRLEATRRGGAIAPGIWAACTAASSSWTSMEPCVVERRAATFSWSLWSFGGAVTNSGLVVGEGWTLIGGGYESIALCEEGLGAYVRSLSPASLRIERSASTSTGPADRFDMTLRDGTHVSWRFSCMRGPTPFMQSP